MVESATQKYEIDSTPMLRTVLCEAKRRVIEGVVYYDASAKSDYPEDSWGLAQYHLPSKNTTPDGTVITKEMAQTPFIALDAMAWEFSIGMQHKWTCFRNLF